MEIFSFGGLAPESKVVTACVERCCRGLLKLEHVRDYDANINIIASFDKGWPCYDQGARNTCVGFATATMMEIHFAINNKQFQKELKRPIRLSPQFIYHGMRTRYPLTKDKQPLGYSDGATLLSQAREVLRKVGVCSYEKHLYQPSSNIASASGGTEAVGDGDKQSAIAGTAPDQDAMIDASTRKYSSFTHDIDSELVNKGRASLIYGLLKQGRPVALGVPTFKLKFGNQSNWERAHSLNTGIVYSPSDVGREKRQITAEKIGGHVVCLIGFQSDTNEPSGGWFIFKNSWDWRFGQGANKHNDEGLQLPGPGYGAISASHVEHYGWEYLSPIPGSFV